MISYVDPPDGEKWRVFKDTGSWWSFHTYSPLSSLRYHDTWEDAMKRVFSGGYFWNEDYTALVGGPH